MKQRHLWHKIRTIKKWRKREPNANDERCIWLSGIFDRDGSWSDVIHETAMRFASIKKLNTVKEYNDAVAYIANEYGRTHWKTLRGCEIEYEYHPDAKLIKLDNRFIGEYTWTEYRARQEEEERKRQKRISRQLIALSKKDAERIEINRLIRDLQHAVKSA